MTYEIGQKVETPLGVGNVVGYHEFYEIYSVDLLTNPEFTDQQFKEYHLKPYKTAHEKLIEMGYEYSQISEDKDDHYYNSSDGWVWFSISNKNYRVSEDVYVDLELSKILTQYLEEMVECLDMLVV